MMQPSARTWLIYLCAVLSIAVQLLPEDARANSTKSFLINSSASFLQGEFHGTSVNGDGELGIGTALDRTALEGVEIAKSIAQEKGGTWLVGTGPKGVIYRVNGGRVEQFATTDTVLVTALIVDDKGKIYAATSPGGKVFVFDRSGKLDKTFALPEAEHVWSLVYDKRADRMIAVTGPKGGVFSISGRGKVDKLFQAKQSNLLSVALGDSQEIYVGSDSDAQIYRIDKANKATVIQDFAGQEVSALSYSKDTLVAVVNDFSSSLKPQDESGFRWSAAVPAKNQDAQQLPQIKGTGQVWISKKGQSFEQYFINRDSYLTSVIRRKSGTLLVGSGQDGRVFEIFDDKRFAVWADFEERQVLGLSDGSEFACVTASLGALYQSSSKRNKDLDWTSNALDAQVPSEWGTITWIGNASPKIETRSGFSEKPDDYWSAWQPLKDLRITSPRARYLQARVILPNKAETIIRTLEIHYLPQNVRTVVSNVRVTRRSSTGDGSPWMDIAWEAQNPDSDPMSYRIRYQRLGDSFWLPLTKEDSLPTSATFGWNTESLPDGHYLVQVEASDETDQPSERKLTSLALSAPVLVDHQAPSFSKLERRGASISGRVTDKLGTIDAIELSVDGGKWTPVMPADQIFDEKAEDFVVEAGKQFSKDARLITFRAKDENGNISAAQSP